MIESQILAVPINARRSRRVVARIRVRVLRRDDTCETITEETHTLVVNAHGALISLAMAVRPGEPLTLENVVSRDRTQVRVVRMGEKQSSKQQVAIEFISPAPHFWHIDFPPEDWRQVPD